MKFVLFVEGQTERESAASFLKGWLDPQMRQPVGIQVVQFQGHDDLIQNMALKARMHLEGPRRSEIIAVIALLDLYGPTTYPPHATSADERFEWAKPYFESKVQLEKFQIFFAVHEFEAWLLSQPEIFPRSIRDRLPKQINQPETINFDEPPAKLLDRIYKQHVKRGYKKTVDGRQLFDKLARLGPAITVDKCPRLKQMLQEMLRLAHDAGL